MAKRKKKIMMEGELVGFQREGQKFVVMVKILEENPKIFVGSRAELITYTD